MKRSVRKVLAFALLLVMMCGCGNTEKVPEGFTVSYLDKEQTKTVKTAYEPMADKEDTASAVEELLSVVTTPSGDVALVKPIPDQVRVLNYEIQEKNLCLNFSPEYTELEPVSEILCRLALVQTFTQLPGVSSLEIFVNSEPLMDSKGKVVGRMTNASFVENPGEQINSIQRSSIQLYFANAKGDGLVKEKQSVYYNSNVALEKLIIEHLMDGPLTTDARSAIPKETKLINVTVADNVCYVNFDSGFMTHNYEIQEPIVIYSIVNSLTELNHIDKVQISVNGESKGMYRDNVDLSVMYEYDGSYVSVSQNKSVVVKDIEEEQVPNE